MKKTFLILTIIFCTAIFGCSVKNQENDLYNKIIKRDKLIVGISLDSMPFGFRGKNGEVSGMEADLAREIAKRLLGDKNKVEFKEVSAQDRINIVQSGEADIVISTMTITPQRRKIINFSDPYFIAGQAICVKKDSKIDSHYDLNNKRIIVILGTTGEKNIKQFAPNALIQGYDDNLEAIEAFKSGKDDAITTDDSLLQGLAIENKDYYILPERLTQEPYGIAFQKNSRSKTFQKKLNEIINQIKIDSTLETIKDRWGIE